MTKQTLVSATYITEIIGKRLTAGQPVSHRMLAVAAALKPAPQPFRVRLEAAMAHRMATPKAK